MSMQNSGSIFKKKKVIKLLEFLQLWLNKKGKKENSELKSVLTNTKNKMNEQ